jgi:hypothetical protein
MRFSVTQLSSGTVSLTHFFSLPFFGLPASRALDIHICVNGQARFVRLQMDNFLWFLCKQTNDEVHLHDEQTVNELRKIALTSVFRFPFETATYISIDTDK